VDAQTTSNLAIAGAALLGAIVGGAASILATVVQTRHESRAQREREARDDKRRRTESKELRERQAAVECDRLVSQVRDVAYLGGRDDSEPYGAAATPLLRALESEIVFLPKSLQVRLDEAVLVLRHADDLNREMYYSSVGWAAHTVFTEVHLAVASWLRGDALPERSDNMCDFILSAKWVQDWFDQSYELQEGQEIAARQAQWRDQNKSELAQIKIRRVSSNSRRLGHS
jgi:hypothetical protein